MLHAVTKLVTQNASIMQVMDNALKAIIICCKTVRKLAITVTMVIRLTIMEAMVIPNLFHFSLINLSLLFKLVRMQSLLYALFILSVTCTDSSYSPWKQNCRYWKSYCSHHAGVRENCKKTCHIC